MNIGQFAKKPELVKIELDLPEIIETYGPGIHFWIMDSVDISTYFEFFKSQSDNDGDKINALMRNLIRNEDGEIVINDDHVLPIDLALASLTAINERLGKSKTRLSTQTVG